MREVLRRDLVDYPRAGGYGPRAVPVYALYVRVGAEERGEVVRREVLRHRARIAADVGAADALVKVHAEDGFAELAVLAVAPQDVLDAVGLRAYGRVGIHQVPRVEHDADARVVDAAEEVLRLRGVGERKAGPPLVFHEEVEGRLDALQQLVYHLYRAVEDGVVVVQPAVGVGLLERYVRDVVDEVFRPEADRALKVEAELLRKLRDVAPAVYRLDHLPRAELAQELRLVAPVKVEPVRVKEHVAARHEAGGEAVVYLVGVPDGLDAVEPEGLDALFELVPVPVGGDAALRDGEIDALYHGGSSFGRIQRPAIFFQRASA